MLLCTYNYKSHMFLFIFRLSKKVCNAKRAKDMVTKDCDDFTVYPEKYFYAIPWWNWRMFFNSSASEAVFNITKSSYVVHVWNKHSITKKIPKNSRVPYLMFAEKYCPQVVKECHNVF